MASRKIQTYQNKAYFLYLTWTVYVTTLLQHQAQLGLNSALRTLSSYLRQQWRGNSFTAVYPFFCLFAGGMIKSVDKDDFGLRHLLSAR